MITSANNSSPRARQGGVNTLFQTLGLSMCSASPIVVPVLTHSTDRRSRDSVNELCNLPRVATRGRLGAAVAAGRVVADRVAGGHRRSRGWESRSQWDRLKSVLLEGPRFRVCHAPGGVSDRSGITTRGVCRSGAVCLSRTDPIRFWLKCLSWYQIELVDDHIDRAGRSRARDRDGGDATVPGSGRRIESDIDAAWQDDGR